MDELNLPVDIIAGTSMGAMAAGIYALYPDMETCIKKVKSTFTSGFSRFNMFQDKKK